MIRKGHLIKYTVTILCFIVSSCSESQNGILINDDKGFFINVTSEAMLERSKDAYAHCWGDINGDNLTDLLVVNHIASPTLFINSGDGTFRDITSSSGINQSGDLHGCAIADYDNDGDQDIYITVGAQRGRGKGQNRLYINTGKGKFEDISVRSVVDDPKGRGRGASWVDYDNDGLLDLFVANDKRDDAPSVLFRNKGNSSFSPAPGLIINENVSYANWIDYDNDGLMDLTVAIYKKHLKGEIRIYKNIGDGTFQKKLTFDGRSYAWGDYNNDGKMDLLVSNPPRVHLLKYEVEILSKIFKGFIKLYKNNGQGQFVDVTDNSGLKDEMGGDQAVFFDYDNDGYLDIYLLIGGTISRNINDAIFKNNGDATFTNITKRIGMHQNFGGRGCGVAYSDYNNDGFLDLFLTNGKALEPYVPGKEKGPYVLYKNRGNDNRWLNIKLIGAKSNRDGIGAHIQLYVGNHMQYRQNNGGMEGNVQHSNIMHFGLGKAERADKVDIIWPSGSITNLTDVKSNQTLLIYEQ